MPAAAPDLSQNPFALLSLIAAPAVLTNAASVLVMSTSNRFLRASERMRAFAVRIEEKKLTPGAAGAAAQAGRPHRAPGGAAAGRAPRRLRRDRLVREREPDLDPGRRPRRDARCDSGSTSWRASPSPSGSWARAALVWACVRLLAATRLSMLNMSEEAALIRDHEQSLAAPP